MPRLVTSPWSSHGTLLRHPVNAASDADPPGMMVAVTGARINGIASRARWPNVVTCWWPDDGPAVI